MALSHIAKARIVSLEDKNESARQCKIHYEHLRKMLLRDFPWGFAKKVARLAKLNIDTPKWKHTYAYPEKCVSVRSVFDENTIGLKLNQREEYEIILATDNIKGICCNVDAACIEYTYDVTEVEVFSSEFIEALSRHLASNMAMILTGNANIQQAQYQLYQLAIQKAKFNMAQEREEDPIFPTKYANARFS
jgi:hypothetical protein